MSAIVLVKERAWQGLSLVILVVAWEALSFSVGRGLLPGPYLVAIRLRELVVTGQFADPLSVSLYRVVFGFLLGFAIALAFGITAGRSRLFNRLGSTVTLIVLFAPTLVLILAGVLVLGLNDLTAILLAGLIVFPPLGIYFRDVMRGVDQEILAMADSFRVRVGDRVRGIYLPHLVPPMLAGARAGFAHAWKIVFLTEAFGLPSGLGFQVLRSYGVFDLEGLIAWLTIFVIVMLLVEQVVRLIERAVVKWEV